MILIVIVGLILIGVLSNYFGKVFEKFKLPSLNRNDYFGNDCLLFIFKFCS